MFLGSKYLIMHDIIKAMSVLYVFIGPLTLFLLYSTLGVQPIYAPEISDLIYLKDSEPFGIPYSNWTSAAWDFHAKLPNDTRVDYLPEKCAWNQNNEYVHFLPGGTAVSSAEEAKDPEIRHCEVPYGKAIYVIIYGGTCNETEGTTYEARKDCAESRIG